MQLEGNNMPQQQVVAATLFLPETMLATTTVRCPQICRACFLNKLSNSCEFIEKHFYYIKERFYNSELVIISFSNVLK